MISTMPISRTFFMEYEGNIECSESYSTFAQLATVADITCNFELWESFHSSMF